MVRVFVVEDHPLMRDMLSEFLATEEGIDVVGVEDSAEAALERLPDPLPDLFLIDMSLPGMSGIELTDLDRAERYAVFVRTVGIGVIQLIELF